MIDNDGIPQNNLDENRRTSLSYNDEGHETSSLGLKSEDEDISFDSPYKNTPVFGKINEIKESIKSVIVGQDLVIDKILISLLAKGHVLIEGVPGVAKTLLARLLARTIDGDFNRIQFTPDLMPSDIIGTMVFDPQKKEFEYKKGPIFAQIVLIDEINRAPAKTQSALFESMEERQVTVDGLTHKLAIPFMVLATQNPIEHEGTYKLPEAQLDRFLMKIDVDYPKINEEIEILVRENKNLSYDKALHVVPVISANDILELQSLTQAVKVEHSIINYIAQIVTSTRQNPLLYMGASPRASIALLNTSKAWALIQDRDFVIPDDVRHMASAVLSHRIVVSPEREMEGMTTQFVIKQIIEKTEIPR